MGKKRGEGAKAGERRMSELALGASARITALEATGELRRRLVELGFFEGERAVKVLESPLGDPSGYLVCGAVTAIRNADAENIIVSTACEEADAAEHGEEAQTWV